MGDTRHSCLIARTEHCARKPVPSLTRLRPGNLRSIPGREFEAPNRDSPPPVIQSIFESNSIFLNLRAGYLVVGSPANLRRFSTTRQRYELASVVMAWGGGCTARSMSINKTLKIGTSSVFRRYCGGKQELQGRLGKFGIDFFFLKNELLMYRHKHKSDTDYSFP